MPDGGLYKILSDIWETIAIPAGFTMGASILGGAASDSGLFPEAQLLLNWKTGLTLGAAVTSAVKETGFLRTAFATTSGTMLGWYVGQFMNQPELGFVSGATVGSITSLLRLGNEGQKVDEAAKSGKVPPDQLRTYRGRYILEGIIAWAFTILGCISTYSIAKEVVAEYGSSEEKPAEVHRPVNPRREQYHPPKKKKGHAAVYYFVPDTTLTPRYASYTPNTNRERGNLPAVVNSPLETTVQKTSAMYS